MPNHIEEPSNNQSTIMHTALTQTKTLKPLGELSLLPRELRDEIYRHIYSNIYICFYIDRYSHAVTEYVRGEPNETKISLLRTSKAILHEAIPFLYSTGTFCFNINISPTSLPLVPPHPKFSITDRMTNINVLCDVGFDPNGQRPFAMVDYASARAGPLSLFQGGSITRKSILVDLRLWQYLIPATEILVSPLFKALKNLIGFKTVTLRVTALAYSFYPPQGTSNATISEWESAGQWDKLYGGLEPLLHAMTKALEPTLGNSCTMSELISQHDSLGFSGQRHVIFHPQDHLAAIAKAKKEGKDRNAAVHSS